MADENHAHLCDTTSTVSMRGGQTYFIVVKAAPGGLPAHLVPRYWKEKDVRLIVERVAWFTRLTRH